MRELRTYGSVRGMGLNPSWRGPAYSTTMKERSRLVSNLEEEAALKELLLCFFFTTILQFGWMRQVQITPSMTDALPTLG